MIAPSEESSTAAVMPEWHLLVVRSRSEKSAAAALRAKGFEAFVPMRVLRRHSSNRVGSAQPLFASFVFCRFTARDELHVLKTPNVFSIFENAGTFVVVPAAEIATLQTLAKLDFPVDLCDAPRLGDTVQIAGEPQVTGILLERGTQCRLAVYLDSLDRTIMVTVPFEALTFARTEPRP